MKNLLPIGTVVQKKSGKPFKSGRKQAVIAGYGKAIVPTAPHEGERKMVERDTYFFSTEADGYFVQAQTCEQVNVHAPIDHHDLDELEAEFIELTLFILTDDVTCDIKAFQDKDARLAEIEKEVGEEIARHWFSLAEDKAVVGLPRNTEKGLDT